MSDASTKKMIEVFMQDRGATMFLTGFFRTRPENFHNSETVEIDIVRSGEDIAIPVKDGSGYNVQTLDSFTNKEFKPPVYKTKSPLKAADMLSRQPGDTAFADVEFRTKMLQRAMRAMNKLEVNLQRSIELQASQIYQGGVVDLKNEDGETVYQLDFGVKANHNVVVGTPWSDPAADIVGDLRTLCDVVRNDSLLDPNQVILGEDAFENAIANDDFLKRFDNRRVDVGSIVPMREGGTGGGNYRGTLDLGNFKVDIWTYGGRYVDPETGVTTQYIKPDSAIVRASAGRMDATFGAIPNFKDLLGGRNLGAQFGLPRRFSSAGGNMDFFTNVWSDDSGETLNIGVGSRPLMIPSDIDSYAFANTGTP